MHWFSSSSCCVRWIGSIISCNFRVLIYASIVHANIGWREIGVEPRPTNSSSIQGFHSLQCYFSPSFSILLWSVKLIFLLCPTNHSKYLFTHLSHSFVSRTVKANTWHNSNTIAEDPAKFKLIIHLHQKHCTNWAILLIWSSPIRCHWSLISLNWFRMKLFSLQVLRKVDDGKAVTLKAVEDVSSFGVFYRGNVKVCIYTNQVMK